VCTMAGILSRSTPSPVTGVVATAWNAGIWGAGTGGGGREGGGAGDRGGGGGGGGIGGGGARPTRARRGAEPVPSGSVPVTWPQATSSNINAPIATASNRRQRRA